MTSRIQQLTNILPASISFSERRLQSNPATEIENAELSSRAVSDALGAGITLFHAAHEREAISLAAALAPLENTPPYLLSTTDGDALARCPDTAEGAAEAILRAITRKHEMLGRQTLDLFSLYDFRREVHHGEALDGAVRAMQEARQAQSITSIGATCYGDYDALADAIRGKAFAPDFVIVRCNYVDRRAAAALIPLCRDLGIDVIATQTFSWRGDIPFTRFPNIWRYRNMTKNFYGLSVAQAHLKWLSASELFDTILVSMQDAAQVAENVAAPKITQLPNGLESLFQSIGEAIDGTDDGWKGLLEDEIWEYRIAAQDALERRAGR
ncbi:hypothetical protein CCAX7_42560 [Capsulimonas corticalis]|uniref:NADP-dependent oxidoreductase domain-containing protein n=1 Tax=Capsulimonas corticalis TaxID=2219043 RepID=A0A9N7L9Z6_9BACT|nr:aldo/keto reductase [Capsulimonas corticalis]BDI32205.1 hypothetical protein CCAX7_42560 [Capsulimonas corticalis]